MKDEKECFWRHGPFKTIKIKEYKYKGSEYEVMRFIAIIECQTCGEIIFKSNY